MSRERLRRSSEQKSSHVDGDRRATRGLKDAFARRGGELSELAAKLEEAAE